MFINMGRVFKQTALRFADNPAVINIERGRRFTYARMHELTNRLSHALKHRFLFHPWMLKSPVGAAWIDVRDSVGEQLSRINHAGPKLVFLENRLLPPLYEQLQACKINLVVMDRPENSRPGVYYFWDLMEQAAPVEVEEEFAAVEALDIETAQ